jgi:hypothetical protein
MATGSAMTASSVTAASSAVAANSAMITGSAMAEGSVLVASSAMTASPAVAASPAMTATAAIGASTAYASVRSYEGYAYADSSDRLLYRESHWLYTADGVGQHLIVYRCANGEPFGRKRVDTSSGAATPDFEMLDARNGYREGARTRDGRREVFVQADAQAPERRASVSLRDNTVIDAGIDAFVSTHWNPLSDTGISSLPFLVPSQLGYVDFSAKKQRDARMDEHDVRWFRFSLASWYAFAAPHLEFGYDVHTHELREYLGPSNIHGNGNKSLNVRIEFPAAERRTDVAPTDVERAATTPLTGRCTFP